MLLLDLSHTSHTRARTGIQRVARAVQRELGGSAQAVAHDPFLQEWRALEPWEQANLADSRGGTKRGAQWPFSARWRGRLRRAFGLAASRALAGEFDALIEPEVFSPAVARALPRLFAQVRGPRVAIFHDSIPLKFPELTPAAPVARYPAYLQELLVFDGIAANSEDSRQALTGYWRWLGVANPPPVAAIALGVTPFPPEPSASATPAGDLPIVLSVGTLEARKNHLALLEACERLWTAGKTFQLRIVGHVNAETGRAAARRIALLRSAGRPIRFDGPASDEDVAQAYRECAFTVYPSIAEGFGLPVIESLARGKPCVCSGRGALGEISRGGGCAAIDSLDPESLAVAIGRLLDQPAELAALADIARERTFRTWADYTADLTAWIRSLPRR